MAKTLDFPAGQRTDEFINSVKKITDSVRSQRKPDNADEYRRFVDMAREVEADQSPGAMDRAFERVVKPKQKGEAKRNKGS